MNHKTELDQQFIYADDPEAVKLHQQMFTLTILFSIPVIGWAILWTLLIAEWTWKKIRATRLMLMILWHKITNFKLSTRRVDDQAN